MNFNNSICRLCLLDTISSVPIFTNNEDGRNTYLAHKIMQIASVQIFEGDGLPALICRSCVNRVEGFFQFKIQVEKSDFFLRQQVCSFQVPNGISLSSLPAGKQAENVKSEHIPVPKNGVYIQDGSWTDNVQSFPSLQNCDGLSEPHSVTISTSQEVTNVLIENSPQTFVTLTNGDKNNEEKSLLDLTQQEERERVAEHPDTHTHFERGQHSDVPVPAPAPVSTPALGNGERVLRKNVVGRDKPVHNYYDSFFTRADGLDFDNSKCAESAKNFYNLDQNKESTSLEIVDSEVKTTESVDVKSNNLQEDGDEYSNENEDDYEVNDTIELGKDTPKAKPKSVTIPYCEECDRHFDKPVSLKKHQAQQHSKPPLKCSFCNKTFRQSWYLNSHIRTHTGERPFTCTICSKTFTDKSALNSHMRVTHFTEKTQVCTFCGKAFKLKRQLERHERIHTGHHYHRCDICGKLFTQKSNLMKHLVLHSGEKPFPCPFCGKPFAQKDNLNIHILRHHSQQNPIVCDICGKLFKNKMTLMGHKKSKHSESVKQIICEVCGKFFPDRSSLNSHKWVHNSGAPVQCDVCGKSYPHARAVRVHKRIVHSEVRKYCCDVCGIGFKTGQTLKHHKVVHTGERAFSCEECGRSFGQKTALKTHQRIHSGVEPYSCPRCGESFKWKQTCDKHIVKCVGKSCRDNVSISEIPIVPS